MVAAICAVLVGMYLDVSRLDFLMLLPIGPLVLLLLGDWMLFSVSSKPHWWWHSVEILVAVATAYAGFILTGAHCNHACGYPLVFVTVANMAIAGVAFLTCLVLFCIRRDHAPTQVN